MGEMIRALVVGGNQSFRSSKVKVGQNWTMRYFDKDNRFEDLSKKGLKNHEMKIPPSFITNALGECEKRSDFANTGGKIFFCAELEVVKDARRRDALMEGFNNFRYAFATFDVTVEHSSGAQQASMCSLGYGCVMEVQMTMYWIHKTPAGVKEVTHKRPTYFYVTNLR